MTAGNRPEYEKRVHRVIDHIRDHLADELTLAALARVAAFSPFHFHRVFAAITGETLFGFIQRVRIERGRRRAHEPSRPGRAGGGARSWRLFAAAFARAFRARFGMSATEWRAGGAERWRARQARAIERLQRNQRQPNRKRSKARGTRSRGHSSETHRGGRHERSRR